MQRDNVGRPPSLVVMRAHHHPVASRSGGGGGDNGGVLVLLYQQCTSHFLCYGLHLQMTLHQGECVCLCVYIE